MNIGAAKICWDAATCKGPGTPLSKGRLYWAWRALYWLFQKETGV